MPKSAGLIISYVDGLLRIAFALLQISIVKKGEGESTRAEREPGSCIGSLNYGKFLGKLWTGFCSQLSPEREI
jgi:hypothetical protein